MRWQDKIEAYKTKAVESGTDEMITRRIWKGLDLGGAYNSKKLGFVEKKLFNSASYDSLDIDRAVSILQEAVSRIGQAWPWNGWETVEVKKVTDIQECIDDDIDYYLFFARLRGSNVVRSVALVPKDDIPDIFEPPYMVLEGNTGCHLVEQDIVDFVKQFGPYNDLWSPE